MQERVNTGVDNEELHGRKIQGVSGRCDVCSTRGRPLRPKRTGRTARSEGTRRKWGGELTPRRALLRRPSLRVQAEVSEGSPSCLCGRGSDYTDGKDLQGKAGA